MEYTEYTEKAERGTRAFGWGEGIALRTRRGFAR